MTSEVVVMNSLAVALAADSAATVTDGRNNKIYNTANKLFTLSKRHPVGVMIHGSASLLGVPWETILKMFRKKIGDEELPRLEDYGDLLVKWLDKNEKLFPQQAQDRQYLRLVTDMLQQLLNKIRELLVEEIIEKHPDGQSVALELAKQQIFKERDKWRTKADSKSLEAGIGEQLATRFSEEINNRITKIFEGFALDADATSALRELAILLVSKDEIQHESFSGLVLAGFGSTEHFPVMQTFDLGEIYGGKLKCRKASVVAIDSERPSVVMPFAQSDMVNTFLFGLSPSFERRMLVEVVTLISNLPAHTIDLITDLSPEKRQQWKDILSPESKKIARHFYETLTRYGKDQHLGPIQQAITHLPKDELAHFAASLVNLNSFQKKMSMVPETVGGPIDVAVISKGDGFIWIDRKHYFKPELNPHFFKNYYHLQPGVNHDQSEQGPNSGTEQSKESD